MQMYYIERTGQINPPMLLFARNIMLVYTNLSLALEKYHSTKLILLSESLAGQRHPSLGINFRFHTKLFKSNAQLEYFVSDNPMGRTLNFPLSLQMNTYSNSNNKYYYILNYNRAEDKRILYLDILYGSMKKARIANDLNVEKWDTLINDMVDINNYQTSLSNKINHYDIVEIECNTPLMANVYYNYEDQIYSEINFNQVVIKSLKPKESMSFTIDPFLSPLFINYTISIFNPVENPDIIFNYDIGKTIHFTENSLTTSFLSDPIPKSLSVTNNGETPTRFIFKLGYEGIADDWIDEKENIEGSLFSKKNEYIYKFPDGFNAKNFTDVEIKVKAIKKGTQEELPNVKFCYSTNIGMATKSSYENCFRTGADIPYSLTFINPLILPKNYNAGKLNYYITIIPYYISEYVSLNIIENKYKVNERIQDGVSNIIRLENGPEKSIILSMPEIVTNNTIFLLQMQLCSSSAASIDYKLINAYTQELIEEHTLNKVDKNYTLPITKLMETELKFIGNKNDKIFTKHIGVNNYEVKLQNYKATFNQNMNEVYIVKPILDEDFNITILIGEKGRFDSYTLCTFIENSENQNVLGDYIETIISGKTNIITHYINFSSFYYEEGHEFDLLVYAVQINNSKLEILYDVITGKVGKYKNEIIKIEDTIPGKIN